MLEEILASLGAAGREGNSTQPMDGYQHIITSSNEVLFFHPFSLFVYLFIVSRITKSSELIYTELVGGLDRSGEGLGHLIFFSLQSGSLTLG